MAETRLLAYVSQGDNHLRHVAQIISSGDWRLEGKPTTLREALNGCLDGTFSGLIIEDTQQLPLATILLQEMRNPLLYLVPIMVLLDKEREEDAEVLSAHFGFDVVTKPISRLLVAQSFASFNRKTLTDTGKRLALVLREYRASDLARRHAFFDSLANDPAVVHRARCAKAALTLSEGMPGVTTHAAQMKAAEAELLRHAKLFPRNAMAFLLLGGLYAEWSMPVLAKRVFQGAAVAAPRFSICNASLAQMHLLLGEVEEAIGSLSRLLQAGFFPDETSFALAKLYFSIGRVPEANKVLQGQAGRFNILQAAWMDSK
ncbi:MAG: hypothetical protein RIQ81_1429 [Pseudomonadota bacterium]|jgi:tetratricopeptide (TPR) repeat protein